jgi:hypothetical protein
MLIPHPAQFPANLLTVAADGVDEHEDEHADEDQVGGGVADQAVERDLEVGASGRVGFAKLCYLSLYINGYLPHCSHIAIFLASLSV